jgi:hypothetical protein
MVEVPKRLAEDLLIFHFDANENFWLHTPHGHLNFITKKGNDCHKHSENRFTKNWWSCNAVTYVSVYI